METSTNRARTLRRARRAAWLESQGDKCARCGSTDRLEVDHIDPSEKELEAWQVWRRCVAVRERELAKCQVLCRECHIIKSALERMAFEHGHSQYQKGCRCDVCKAGCTAYERQRHGWNERGERHGIGRYRNPRYRCRCDICRAANAAQARKDRAARKEAKTHA